MHGIVLPELGEGIDRATVAQWLVQVGDHVRQDEDMVELVTDKASFTVPAGRTGIVRGILASEGQDVRVGERLAVIEPAG